MIKDVRLVCSELMRCKLRFFDGCVMAVIFEHVHVNDGGQAVIGNVRTRGDGDCSG